MGNLVHGFCTRAGLLSVTAESRAQVMGRETSEGCRFG